MSLIKSLAKREKREKSGNLRSSFAVVGPVQVFSPKEWPKLVVNVHLACVYQAAVRSLDGLLLQFCCLFCCRVASIRYVDCGVS